MVRARLGAVAWPALVVTLITAGAFAQRVSLALGDGLPLGDGGMFYAVIEQIKAGGYRFPDYVSYNETEIPFAYSPLSFYAAAVLSDITGLDSLTILRFLPMIVSCLTIPAFYLMAKAILKREDVSLLATAFFATHASFAKLIMGGGLTRSFGLLFAILAIYHLYHLTRDDATPRRALLTALFMTLTVLSHPEMAWLVALFYAVILCAFTRSWRDLLYPIGVVLLCLALTAAWWGIVLERHGIEPYLGALDSGNANALTPLGLLAIPLSRRWLLPALLVASIYFGGRNVDFPEGIAVAILLGSATSWILPRLRFGDSEAPAGTRALRALGHAGAAVGVIFMAAIWLGQTNDAIGSWLGRPAGEADSFAWIKQMTSEESRFVVIADTDEWGYDHTGEWLPELTRRQSLTTVQGSEWLRGAEGYPAAKANYQSLRECVTEGTSCLEAWSPVQKVAYTHVYITKDVCCVALRESLAGTDGYALVYDGVGAQVYERLNPP